MTPPDAARLLELPGDATPEQIEARFLDLRSKLEDKIVRSPTPGLKEKYRATLAEVTEAFETLTLAADSSALPVLKREEAGNTREESRLQNPESEGVSPHLKSRIENRKSPKSGREFIVVTAIAIAVLSAGGWWVMRIRTENAEKARMAAETKAEAERQSQLARDQAEEERRLKEAAALAEQRRQAEERRLAEEERVQLAAAAKAEQERQEKLMAQLRARVAELNVDWDAAARTETIAERELSELKSEERERSRGGTEATLEARRFTARLRAHERYVAQLRQTLPTHPARFARAKVEELLSARAADSAAVATEEYERSLLRLKSDLAEMRGELVTIGSVAIETNLADATWKLTDAIGAEQSGRGRATLTQVAIGRAHVVVSAPKFQDIALEVEVRRTEAAIARAEFRPATVIAEVTPTNARVSIRDAQPTSDRTWQLPPGDYVLTAHAPGFMPQFFRIGARQGETETIRVNLEPEPAPLLIAKARKLIAEIPDEKELLFAAFNLARAERELGDPAAIRSLCQLLASRKLDLKEPTTLPVFAEIALIAMALGERETARPLVSLYGQSLTAMTFNPAVSAHSLHCIMAALQSAAGDEAAALASVDRAIGLKRDFWVGLGQRANADRNTEWKVEALAGVAGILIGSGLLGEAERWQKQLIGLKYKAVGGFEPVQTNLHFSMAAAQIRLDQVPAAMVSVQEGIHLELANAERLDAMIRKASSGKMRNKYAVKRLHFLAPLQVARLTGRRYAVERIVASVRQLETAGMILEEEDGSPSPLYRLLADDSAYAARGQELAGAEFRTLEEVSFSAAGKRAEAVSFLSQLWLELRTFGVVSTNEPTSAAQNIDLHVNPVRAPVEQKSGPRLF